MPSAPSVQAWRSPAAWAFLLAVVASALALDLWSKEWAFRTVAGQPVVLEYEQVSGNTGYAVPWHPGQQVIPPSVSTSEQLVDFADFQQVDGTCDASLIGHYTTWALAAGMDLSDTSALYLRSPDVSPSKGKRVSG